MEADDYHPEYYDARTVIYVIRSAASKWLYLILSSIIYLSDFENITN